MSKLSDIRNRMVNADEADYDTDAFIGIYGESGVGKTTLALELALQLTEGDVLLLDTSDNGMAVKGDAEGVVVLDVETGEDTAVIADALNRRLEGFETFGAVVIDELSTIGKLLLDGYVRERDGLKSDEPIGDFEAKYYGAAAGLLRQFVYTIKSTDNLHVIALSHERKITVQADGDRSRTTQLAPEYWPTALTEVQKLMHVHSRMTASITTQKGQPVYKRELQSLPTPTVSAKDRLGLPLYSSPDEWVAAITNYYNK